MDSMGGMMKTGSPHHKKMVVGNNFLHVDRGGPHVQDVAMRVKNTSRVNSSKINKAPWYYLGPTIQREINFKTSVNFQECLKIKTRQTQTKRNYNCTTKNIREFN